MLRPHTDNAQVLVYLPHSDQSDNTTGIRFQNKKINSITHVDWLLLILTCHWILLVQKHSLMKRLRSQAVKNLVLDSEPQNNIPCLTMHILYVIPPTLIATRWKHKNIFIQSSPLLSTCVLSVFVFISWVVCNSSEPCLFPPLFSPDFSGLQINKNK